VGERAAVDVFEFTTDGDAVRDAAGPDVSLRGAFTEKMRSGLAFHGRIRGEDHLVHFTGIEQGFEFTCADLFRADAIERTMQAPASAFLFIGGTVVPADGGEAVVPIESAIPA